MTDRSPLPAIAEARTEDAPVIAAIHLTARQQAMPYLQPAHTDDETRDYFARTVGDRPLAWWVVHHLRQVVACMLIDGENLDHLYVSPHWQGQGFGSALLDKAKALSPRSPSAFDISAERKGACFLRSARLSPYWRDGRGKRGTRAGCAIRMAAGSMNDAAFPVAADSRGALTQLDQLAAISEEEIWLAKQKSPQTRLIGGVPARNRCPQSSRRGG